MKKFGYSALFLALTFVQVGCGEPAETPAPTPGADMQSVTPPAAPAEAAAPAAEGAAPAEAAAPAAEAAAPAEAK